MGKTIIGSHYTKIEEYNFHQYKNHIDKNDIEAI